MVDFSKLNKKNKEQPALPAPEAKPAKQARKKAGALVSMKEMEKWYAERGKAAAEAAPIAGGVPVISTKGEQFQIGDNLLPDELQLIVVAEALLNVYYDSEYDPANPTSPACFAVMPAEKGAETKIVSHETSPNRQGGVEFKCQGCEMNQFGSAERGKGKACGNYRRLAVVFADDPKLRDGSETPTWGILNLPPTSLGDWGKFVQGLERVEHRPPEGAIIKFTFDRKNPDSQKRKRVIAIGYQLIQDVGVAMKVRELREEILASGALVRPLPVDNYVDPGAKQPTTARGRVATAKAKNGAKLQRPRAAPAEKPKRTLAEVKAARRQARF